MTAEHAPPEPGAPATDLPVADLAIDTSGLTCPLPILRAKKALAGLVSGQVLKVVSTDRNAVADFQAFCRQTGHVLLHQDVADPIYTHYLRRR